MFWWERGHWAGSFSNPEVAGFRLVPLKMFVTFSSFAATPPTEPVNKKPRGQRWRETPEEEPVRKKRSRSMTKNLDLDSDPDPDPDPGGGGAPGGGSGCGAPKGKPRAPAPHLSGAQAFRS